MLKLLLALLSLLASPFLPASGPGHSPASEAGPAHHPHDLVIDHHYLPGATGWFLVSVEVEEPGTYGLEVSLVQASSGADRSQAAVLMGADGRLAVMGGPAGGAGDNVEVNDGGGGVRCCRDGFPVFGTWTTVGESGVSGTSLAQDTLWFGLVAAGWEPESELEIRLTPGTARLRLGEVRQGSDVTAVDLVDLAHRQGRNVRLEGRAVAGETADLAMGFSPTATGVLMLDYFAYGSASARLDLTVGGATATSSVHELWGRAVLAQRDTTFLVALSEVHGGTLGGALLGEGGEVQATLLYADLDLPFELDERWEEPWHT